MQQEVGFDFAYTEYLQPTELERGVWAIASVLLWVVMAPNVQQWVVTAAAKKPLWTLAFPLTIAGILLADAIHSGAPWQGAWVSAWVLSPRIAALIFNRQLRARQTNWLRFAVALALWIWIPVALQTDIKHPEPYLTIWEFAWPYVVPAVAITFGEFVIFKSASTVCCQWSRPLRKSGFTWLSVLAIGSATFTLMGIFSDSNEFVVGVASLAVAVSLSFGFCASVHLVWRHVFFGTLEAWLGAGRASLTLFALFTGVWMTLFLGGRAAEPTGSIWMIAWVVGFGLPALLAGKIFRSAPGLFGSFAGAIAYTGALIVGVSLAVSVASVLGHS